MKKSTGSTIIGAMTFFISSLFAISVLAVRSSHPGFDPIIIMAGAIVTWMVFLVISPLALIGIVIGIMSLRSDEKKNLAWIGIILNLVAVFLIAYPFAK